MEGPDGGAGAAWREPRVRPCVCVTKNVRAKSRGHIDRKKDDVNYGLSLFAPLSFDLLLPVPTRGDSIMHTPLPCPFNRPSVLLCRSAVRLRAPRLGSFHHGRALKRHICVIP